MIIVFFKVGNDLIGDWSLVWEFVVDDESLGEVGGIGEVFVFLFVWRLFLELWIGEDFLLIFGVVLGVFCLDGMVENVRIGFGWLVLFFNVSFGFCKIGYNF